MESQHTPKNSKTCRAVAKVKHFVTNGEAETVGLLRHVDGRRPTIGKRNVWWPQGAQLLENVTFGGREYYLPRPQYTDIPIYRYPGIKKKKNQPGSPRMEEEPGLPSRGRHYGHLREHMNFTLLKNRTTLRQHTSAHIVIQVLWLAKCTKPWAKRHTPKESRFAAHFGPQMLRNEFE